MTFETFGLSPEILRAVSEQGYEIPTPIQDQAIPLVLAGRDLMGRAQTGTGKTAAFALPMLQSLTAHANTSFSPARHPVRALILAPTRELAVQVYDSFRTYGKHVPLRYSVVYGGVAIEPQTKELLAGVEVLVATPGRLLDHVGQRTVNLTQVDILVLDEADRMLDMGFLPDIRRIVAMVANRKQTLLFSATFSTEIRKLAETLLNNPVSVDIEPQTTSADSVDQVVYLVDSDRKRELLAELVRRRNLHQVLVFTRTKLMAGRLASQLDRDGVEAISIHGDRSQPERERALAAFKAGEVRVLVATDVAARGLDIEALPLVVNYEMPHTPHDYVHRIGRTGRAGATGHAISLVAPEEEDYLKQVNRLLKRDLPVRVVKGYEPSLNGPRRAPAARSSSRSGSDRRPRSPRPAPARRSPARASAAG
ncbi:MAG TPA: DEAD/DEAH box helicase [Candidatus Limnocylindrales bacterium]|nr:DEAD/DEAH box helicase [Candidatus Limnocylindrales bacterium]